MRRIDITGYRFGKLVGVAPLPREQAKGNTLWLVACDCGKAVTVALNALRCGHTKSCGCAKNEYVSAATTRHGHARSPRGQRKRSLTYVTWQNIVNRCSNPGSTQYRWYGARGIRICEEWRDFAVFLRDVGERPSRLHSIDRINVNGHYEPGNCRWATATEQARNRRAAS